MGVILVKAFCVKLMFIQFISFNTLVIYRFDCIHNNHSPKSDQKETKYTNERFVIGVNLINSMTIPSFYCCLFCNTKKTIDNDDDDNSKEMRLNCDTIRELSTFNNPLLLPLFYIKWFFVYFTLEKECTFCTTTNKN